MEHALRDTKNFQDYGKIASLNPYCNGTCSKRVDIIGEPVIAGVVLILIVMEHALRGEQKPLVVVRLTES